MILCDTNVLIEFYRGTPGVVEALRAISVHDLAISIITAAELYYGARDKSELRQIQKHLAVLRQITVDSETAEVFLSLVETYSLSHKLNIPDALIAATALQGNIPLYTLNVKDFRFIKGLDLYTPEG
jgi:tRNA(fMet)-specific endonuclease VapC